MDLLELEDILYGLEYWGELRPTPERIQALLSANSDDPDIQDMIEIWQSGHGVLYSQKRVEALRRLLARNK